MSFHRFTVRLPAPHSKLGNGFVLPSMLLPSSEPNENGPIYQEGTFFLPQPLSPSQSYLQGRAPQPGRPMSRGGTGRHRAVGRHHNPRTTEVLSRLLEGRDREARKPMFTEHILCAKDLTHIILFNPRRSPVR